jgi:medium-chain acyl-[acyl-carrier-protein] hydrolase
MYHRQGRVLMEAASEPAVTLFCIPHAGGGASAYRNWGDALAPGISVGVLQLPGRESRFREPPLSELDDVLADLWRVMAPQIAGPFALFGHSMGALLAFELCHMLRRERGRQPARLFVSACRAPQLAQLATSVAALPQAAFIAEVMRRYGGIPPAILADSGYMAAILPAMRADFGILESYRAPEREPLDCPISAFGGTRDMATPPSTLAGWRSQSSAEFSLDLLDGDHFYLQTQRVALTSKIRSALRIGC